MHGLRQAPGSNHVKVSFLGVFMLSFVMFVGVLASLFVISKYNVLSSDGTSQLCLAFPIVLFLFRGLYPRLHL